MHEEAKASALCRVIGFFELALRFPFGRKKEEFIPCLLTQTRQTTEHQDAVALDAAYVPFVRFVDVDCSIGRIPGLASEIKGNQGIRGDVEQTIRNLAMPHLLENLEMNETPKLKRKGAQDFVVILFLILVSRAKSGRNGIVLRRGSAPEEGSSPGGRC